MPPEISPVQTEIHKISDRLARVRAEYDDLCNSVVKLHDCIIDRDHAISGLRRDLINVEARLKAELAASRFNEQKAREERDAALVKLAEVEAFVLKNELCFSNDIRGILGANVTQPHPSASQS